MANVLRLISLPQNHPVRRRFSWWCYIQQGCYHIRWGRINVMFYITVFIIPHIRNSLPVRWLGYIINVDVCVWFALDVHETSTISRILLACLTYMGFVLVLGLGITLHRRTYALFLCVSLYVLYSLRIEKICARIYNACRNVNLVSLGGWLAFAIIFTSGVKALSIWNCTNLKKENFSDLVTLK